VGHRVIAAAAVLAALAVGAPAASAQDGFTKQALSFGVKVGPQDDQACTVVGDLYKPDAASAASPAPAILATNGFGGSKDDFTTLAPSYAKRGYVFLAYSGLGFGGSGCKITLDDPDYDGKAGSQLVTYLGGLDYVTHDGPGDPRMGMIGGSYGGQIQFAVAGLDKRVDALNPQITWNDLSYSLSPNNTAFTKGVSYDTPGVVKLDWPTLFTSVGVLDGLQGVLNGDPSHAGACPNFPDAVCQSLVQGASRGYLDDTGVALLRHASVASYMDRITVPTFLSQGQSDNLFNLQESVATYEALRAQGAPVKLLWRSSGHSGGGLGKAESDSTDLEAAYESRMSLEWFDHYLKGAGPAPRLDFSFLTDWLPYEGDAAEAVGSTPAYPAGSERSLYLSGTDALAPDAGGVQAGEAAMASPGAAPTSTGGGLLSSDASDAPGTSVAYAKTLDADLDVVGVPTVTLHLDAPSFAGAGAADPAAQLVLFAKLYDVAPDGTITLPRNQVSAVRVADPSQPVTIGLPGIVHRFPAGHTVKLVVATTAATYRGSATAGPVTVKTDPAAPGELRLPVVGAPTGPAGSGPDGTTPFASVATFTASSGAKAKRRAAKGFRRSCARRTVTFRLRAAKRLNVARVGVNGKHRRTVRARFGRRVVVRHVARGKLRVVVTSTGKRGARRRSVKRFARCG
jgi:predicted acyl esterase